MMQDKQADVRQLVFDGPSIVFIRLLEACNARCRMCRYAGSEDPFRLDLSKFKKLVTELSAMGCREVRFTGGEPLLFESILAFIRIVRDHGMRCSLITNGAFLEAMASDLVASGLTGLTVSIDSSDSNIHDSIRATKGLFDLAVRGVEAIKREKEKAGIELSLAVNSIVSRQTYVKLPELVTMAKKLGVDVLRLIPVKDMKGMWLTETDVATFNRMIPEVQQSVLGSGLRVLVQSLEIFGSNESEIKKSISGKSLNYSKCFVPLTMAYIDAKKGMLTACNCLAHRKGDSLTIPGVWENSFRSLWCDPKYREKREAFACLAPKACTGCDPANALFNSEVDRAIANATDLPEWI